MLCRERDDGLAVIGHVARANPQTRAIVEGVRATLVFQGTHAYVSASWYEEPYATVPTWNYTAVHVLGKLSQFDAWQAVRLLSQTIEGSGANAWDPDRLDERYRNKQLLGIVAFELRAEAVFAKAKLSQNRTDADRRRVIERLRASRDQTDRECAEAMTDAGSRACTSSAGSAIRRIGRSMRNALRSDSRRSVEREIAQDSTDRGGKLETMPAAGRDGDVGMTGQPIDDEVAIGRQRVETGLQAAQPGRARLVGSARKTPSRAP